MEKLILDATSYTPKIEFNNETGVLSIQGKSYPENTFDFYKPVISWIKEYFSTDAPKTIINFELLYLNSSSLKAYFDIFEMFENYSKSGHDIQINWIFDEEDDVMEEIGEDFHEDFEDLTFNFVSK